MILAPMENSTAVTVLALIGSGSKNETKELNGISHFIEHTIFKGTKNRPNPGDIHGELDRIGASHNAFTGSELTGYWIKTAVKDFDLSLDIISDMIKNPLFKEEELEKEKGVILQEINMIEDDPSHKVLYKLLGTIYGDQPAGRDVSGTKESVSSIKREDISKYLEENYVPSNITIIVSGGIKKEESFKKIEKIFGKLKRNEIKDRKQTIVEQKNPQVNIIKKETDQSHLAIGILAYDMFDERRYALNLLSTILGGNLSSRLSTEIREKLGLAYYIGSGIFEQTDTGLLIVKAGVAHDKLERVSKKIYEIFADLKKNGVTKKELNDAKSNIRGQMALSFETTDQVAEFYGEQEVFHKKLETPDDILKKIEKVSQSDILKVARDIFRPEKISMAVIGRHDNGKKNIELYKKIWIKI